MRIRYQISSCVRDSFQAVADIAGKPQEVTINGLVIEATSEDGAMGHTFKLRGEPAELDAAYERAQHGGELFVTLEVVDPETETPIHLAQPLPVEETEETEGEAPQS